MPYELRIAYDPSIPIGEADVRSRHGSAHPAEAARAFVECSAPFKQIVFEEDGELSALDALEEAYVRGYIDGAGYEIGEVEG